MTSQASLASVDHLTASGRLSTKGVTDLELAVETRMSTSMKMSASTSSTGVRARRAAASTAFAGTTPVAVVARVTKRPLPQQQQKKRLSQSQLKQASTLTANSKAKKAKGEPTSIPAEKEISLPSTETTKRLLKQISTHPTLTPYRRRVYATLLSVPAGRWTTYAALSTHLASSARAVGNAMRTNPFAPDVPCHRVLAANGTLGGYKGSWVGKTDYDQEAASQGVEKLAEKKRLLEEEGVVFDEKGKPMGMCFRDFRMLKA